MLVKGVFCGVKHAARGFRRQGDGGLTALGPGMWQRIDMPREATLTKANLSKGTTGEPGTARKL